MALPKTKLVLCSMYVTFCVVLLRIAEEKKKKKTYKKSRIRVLVRYGTRRDFVQYAPYVHLENASLFYFILWTSCITVRCYVLLVAIFFLQDPPINAPRLFLVYLTIDAINSIYWDPSSFWFIPQPRRPHFPI